MSGPVRLSVNAAGSGRTVRERACGRIWRSVRILTRHTGELIALQVVDLPKGVGYTWRDIARGPGDLAYIIGTDGAIHVLDPETGKMTGSFPVIDAWEGPAEWQDPHPAITVVEDIAYVTEPAANSIHAVNLTTGEIVATRTLDVTTTRSPPPLADPRNPFYAPLSAAWHLQRVGQRP